MNWLFRPATVVAVSLTLAGVAAGILFWPLGEAASANRAVPRPVPAGDQEVAWLNAATSAVTWERFVAAARRLVADRPDLGLELVPEADPFPTQTTVVPELAFRARGGPGRLWVRWYKLTGDLGPGAWAEAFARRDPPPLAVIGGGSSDRAWEQAGELNQRRLQFAAAPLFLITTATADEVGVGQDLMKVYEGRTFRFCFTNRQMAEAVTDFVWSQEDLRPDGEPVYLTHWSDDPYSEDLFEQFRRVLEPVLQYSLTLKAAARDWAWGGGVAAVGAPAGLDLQGLRGMEARSPFWSTKILYSVGAFRQPNPWEVQAAEYIVTGMDQHPAQRRPLLVLPAMPQPARRFLHALFRTAPQDAERFVVATGDAIDFNTVYRDRNLAWPIQDLPVPLVFFCHRNPVDPVAFQPSEGTMPPDPTGRTSTGTQDLLLYRDILEAVARAAFADGRLAPDADALLRGLRAPGPTGGLSGFDEEGNQRGGLGEYVVCLRPVRAGDRLKPLARMQVWSRQSDPEAGRNWVPVPVAGDPELTVPYTTATGSEGADGTE
jgi:hypothetical protein